MLSVSTQQLDIRRKSKMWKFIIVIIMILQESQYLLYFSLERKPRPTYVIYSPDTCNFS